MTHIEALKLAHDLSVMHHTDDGYAELRAKVRSATKEALAQPEQPKVRTGDCLLVGVCASEGHKIQPQRTWVGLTESEIIRCSSVSVFRFYDAIEAKLKEKNT